MDRNTVVQRRSEPIFSRLDDELLALDPKQGLCYSLSGVGTRVWELIGSPTAIGTVCDRLAEEYATDPDSCSADVLEFVSELAAAGLVELESPA